MKLRVPLLFLACAALGVAAFAAHLYSLPAQPCSADSRAADWIELALPALVFACGIGAVAAAAVDLRGAGAKLTLLAGLAALPVAALMLLLAVLPPIGGCFQQRHLGVSNGVLAAVRARHHPQSR